MCMSLVYIMYVIKTNFLCLRDFQVRKMSMFFEIKHVLMYLYVIPLCIKYFKEHRISL